MSDLTEKEIATTGLSPQENAKDSEDRSKDGKLKGTFRKISHGQNNNLNDLGRDLLEKSLEYDEAQLERDAVKVRRRLDFYVLPMVGLVLFNSSVQTMRS